jgi:Tfp pilus assembly protein PilX
MISNKKGSVLVLVVIIIAAITVLGATILNITMIHMQIKKSNSELKRSFYLSEDGINNAYLRVNDLISEAIENSIDVADDYLKAHTDDIRGASRIFVNNYKLYIINNVVSRINDNSNPYTDVLNVTELTFMQDKLKVNVSSKYISEFNVEKFTSADIIIAIPNYQDIVDGNADISTLIIMDNFDL